MDITTAQTLFTSNINLFSEFIPLIILGLILSFILIIIGR